MLTKAHEEEIKRLVLFHMCKSQKEGTRRSGRWCWWRKGPKKKKKKPLKMNHGKAINKRRTVRVGVRTFSFPLERNNTLQLTTRFGEGRPGAQQDQDRRMSFKGQKRNFRQKVNQIRMVRSYM